MALMVTDPRGMPLGGIRVMISGPSERSGTTDSGGLLRVTGLQVGTYRLRFSGDSTVPFEREVTVRSGVTADIDVTLTLAPPPPAPPPAPAAPAEPAKAVVGPAGRATATSLLDYLERNKIRAEPRREVLISCSGNTRATLLQLNENQAQRLYEDAEVTYYVVEGDGTFKVPAGEGPIGPGSFISVPRNTPYEILRRGRRPLIVVVQVSGVPCDEAK
jgi:mannose-6-phosphate isomerase-like protein (cupin superfamily)